MPKSFHTPDQKQIRKRATTNDVILCSTPQHNKSIKHHSISLSGIDTASSSSEGRIEKKLQSQISIRKKRRTNKKKREIVQLKNTDDEWETLSEESIPEKRDDASAYINLFENPCTPEKIRDAPITYEEPLHKSPIIQTTKLRSVSKKSIMQQDELLPINLPLLEMGDPEETAEDEMIFRHDSNLKTYKTAQKSKESPRQNPENDMFPTKFLTAKSNLLWDQFVEKHCTEMCQNLASTSARAPIKLTDFQPRLPDVPRKPGIVPIPPGMARVQGRWDKASRKWIRYYSEHEIEQTQTQNSKHKTGSRKKGKRKRKRKTTALRSKQKQGITVYDQFDETDIEFKTGGQDGKRMTLPEFRYKQMANKVFDKSSSTSFHLDTQ